MASSVWAITELRRTGAGVLQENPEGARFVWDGATHTLPVADVDITQQVNTVRTVYPGTEHPVEQVLSFEIAPFDISGEWNDKFNFPGFAAEQELAMDALHRRGALVRMDFEQFSLTGIITHFTRGLRHRTHLTWSLTFSPHYRDTQDATVRGGQVISSGARPLREQAQETEEVIQATTASHDAGRGLALATASYPVTGATVLAATTTQAGINARASAGLTDNSAEELRTQQERYASLQAVGATQAARLATVRSDDATSFDSVVQRLGFALWSRGVRTGGRVTLTRSFDAQRELDLVLVAQTRAVIRPSVGSSVYRVAGDFATSPEGWRDVALANNRSELFFDGVTELTVPVERTS
jgi:hypothetical protein